MARDGGLAVTIRPRWLWANLLLSAALPLGGHVTARMPCVVVTPPPDGKV